MSIPADHISFNDDGTAWWVTPKLTADLDTGLLELDRPCDWCKGTALTPWEGSHQSPCSHCIDGRHTFTIEVEPDYNAVPHGSAVVWGPPLALRVSVIPGMVLPIVDATTWDERPYVAIVWQRPPYGTHYMGPDDENGDPTDGEPVTLPPAAAPGMWAVKLKVAA